MTTGTNVYAQVLSVCIVNTKLTTLHYACTLFYYSFATRFGDEFGIGNFHPMADGLDHVIDSECRHGRPHQGLHFHPRLVRDPTRTVNDNFMTCCQVVNVDLDLIQWQWMTKRNQITRFPGKRQTNNR
jgi:hypothetical protein